MIGDARMKTGIQSSILASLVAGLLVVGCSKKQTEPQQAAADTNTAPVEAAAAPAVEEQPAAPAPTPTQSAEVDARLREAALAMKKRDYEAAVKSMLTLQMANTPMTQQQGFDQINRMRDLSRMITEAWSRGDANAARAAEMLRNMHAARTAR